MNEHRNGGADANKHAVRMARLHTGRYKVLSRYRSYHGGTDTAINLTGDPRRWPNDYSTSGVVHFSSPFLYWSLFHSCIGRYSTPTARSTGKLEGGGVAIQRGSAHAEVLLNVTGGWPSAFILRLWRCGSRISRVMAGV